MSLVSSILMSSRNNISLKRLWSITFLTSKTKDAIKLIFEVFKMTKIMNINKPENF